MSYDNSKKAAKSGYVPSFGNALQRIMKYKWRAGMFAWILHRVTGLGLVIYLFIHVLGLRALYDPVKFDELITLYRMPLFKIGEFIILLAVTYHSINGFRIVAVDFLGWSPKQKKLLYVTIFLSLVIILLGGYPIFAPYLPFVN